MWRNMAEGAHQSLYPPSKRVKSEVWKYFGYRKNEQGSLVEDNFPICKKCSRKVAVKHGNTSNMFSHLRNHHPIQFREITMSLTNKEQTRLKARVSTNPFARAMHFAKRRESGHVEVNSQCQQESVINSASIQTDCSSVTHESPVSSPSWVKQEPRNDTNECESMNSEVHIEAEQDNTLSNAISTTTLFECMPSIEMLTITKLQCMLDNKQEKIEALEKQVQDLQEDRMFLRTQIGNLTNVLSSRFCECTMKVQEK
ncbi:uncharacterized protein [Misgurnus anguillicaudatus]|uniref:uncharacterized protein n=1 Tax=Misgurnus anguillicaudatus TaxID=75329 RepID=UPI003CCF9078